MLRASAIVSLAFAAAVSVAHAQTPESTKLFEEGRALAKAGKFSDACAKFEKSLELDPAVGTKLNDADCHEHLGHFAVAYRLFNEAADADAATNVDRSKYARGRADALAAKVGTVVVRVEAPDGVELTIGGRTVPVVAANVREVVDPGQVLVQANHAAGAGFTKIVDVAAGATVVVEVPAVTAPMETPVDGGRRKSRVYAAYTLGGVGAASLTAGIVLGFVARGRYREQIDAGNCTDTSPPLCNVIGYSAQSNARTLANVGTGFGVAGLAVIGAGAVVFLTAPRDLVVAPTVSERSAGVTVVGRF
jgi:tetratricopeptide (TPR) repeat protein